MLLLEWLYPLVTALCHASMFFSVYVLFSITHHIGVWEAAPYSAGPTGSIYTGVMAISSSRTALRENGSKKAGEMSAYRSRDPGRRRDTNWQGRVGRKDACWSSVTFSFGGHERNRGHKTRDQVEVALGV